MFGKTGPARITGRQGTAAANQQARFLIGFADGRESDGARPGVARPRACAPELCVFGRMQLRSHRHARVGGVGTPAGKHEPVGHEGVVAAAPPEQHAEVGARPVEQDERCRITRPLGSGPEREILAFGAVKRLARHDGYGVGRRGAHGSEFRRPVFDAAETMHPQRPLQADDRTLHRLD